MAEGGTRVGPIFFWENGGLELHEAFDHRNRAYYIIALEVLAVNLITQWPPLRQFGRLSSGCYVRPVEAQPQLRH